MWRGDPGRAGGRGEGRGKRKGEGRGKREEPREGRGKDGPARMNRYATDMIRVLFLLFSHSLVCVCFSLVL